MADKFCKRADYELMLRAFSGVRGASMCCKAERAVPLDRLQDLDIIKQQLNNGERPEHCSFCWRQEDAGVKSWRQEGNEMNFNFKTIEVYLDSTCDQTCLYCNSKYSSMWQQEGERANERDKKFLQDALILWPDEEQKVADKKRRIQQILDNISTYVKPNDTVDEYQIALLGGEPLLSAYVKNDIISDIVDAFYKNVRYTTPLQISFITNGNSPEHVIDRTIETITKKSAQYPNLKFVVSLSNESTGKVSELIRYGLDYERFVNNFIKYMEADCKVGFTMTINALSILETPKFMRDMLDITKKCNSKIGRTFFKINPVYQPQFLGIGMLPKSYSTLLDECKDIIHDNMDYILDNHFADTTIKGLNDAINLISSDSNKYYRATISMTYFDYIKRNRGMDVEEICPEIYKLLYDMAKEDYEQRT